MRWLLHTKRVPVLESTDCTSEVTNNVRPSCTGIGDTEKPAWICHHCASHLCTSQPRMPPQALANWNWGGSRASHVLKSINGHSEFARIGKADYATGTAEADRQHGRVRKSTGGKHDSGGTTITRDDRSGIATHRFRTGYILQRRVWCWCFRARFDQAE